MSDGLILSADPVATVPTIAEGYFLRPSWREWASGHYYWACYDGPRA